MSRDNIVEQAHATGVPDMFILIGADELQYILEVSIQQILKVCMVHENISQTTYWRSHSFIHINFTDLSNYLRNVETEVFLGEVHKLSTL